MNLDWPRLSRIPLLSPLFRSKHTPSFYSLDYTPTFLRLTDVSLASLESYVRRENHALKSHQMASVAVEGCPLNRLDPAPRPGVRDTAS